MSNFQAKRGDRHALTAQELETLDTKVLPKARQWVAEYPEGSTLWGHGKSTMAYWGDHPT